MKQMCHNKQRKFKIIYRCYTNMLVLMILIKDYVIAHKSDYEAQHAGLTCILYMAH